MDNKCSVYIDGYMKYLMGSETDKNLVAGIKEHIRNCTACKANLSVFSTILEKRLAEDGVPALSCSQVQALAERPDQFRKAARQRQEAINHMISCRPCRDKFIDKFVTRLEKDKSVFHYAIDIPDLKSPLLLLELKKEKKSEIISAIRTAEASIVKVKADGGIKYGVNDLIEKRLESLPPYPDNVRQIVELIDVDADLSDIAREVSRDVSMSARILQIANSRHYRGRHPINDIQRGLSRIGLQAVSRIVRVFGLHSVIMNQAGKRLDGYGIPMKSFLNYSTMLAVIAMSLAPKYDPREIKAEDLSLDVEMIAYTAGLISNMGMIVLNHCIDKKFRERLEDRIEQGREITLVEEELFGITHPEISARILKKWNLSESFINGIIRHHAHSCGGEDMLSKILYTSDTIAESFLRPASRVRPYLNVISSSDEFMQNLPFQNRAELDAFYQSELMPAFDGHNVQYDRKLPV